MFPILWDAVNLFPLGYMGDKVLLIEHENDNLVSPEIKDSIGSRQLGVQEFHSWEAVHLDCHCIHWGQIFQGIKY